jgi:hypothetical protein
VKRVFYVKSDSMDDFIRAVTVRKVCCVTSNSMEGILPGQ